MLTLWEAAAREFETPQVRWDTPGALARATNPSTIQTAALDVIDEAITDLYNRPDGRLILSCPPQVGKSQRCARWFPLWVLTQNPDARIAIVSYEHNVARRWGRAIRDDILSHPELGLRVRTDLAAQHEWELAGHQGGVYTAGIGAALTGRPVDCITGDMHIECEYGRITAAEAFRRGITRILAYDHASGRAVWRRVEAARRIERRDVIEISTEDGRVLACTPDHRVYSGRGYVPAGSLQIRDSLVAAVDAHRVPLRDGAPGRQGGDPQGNHPRSGAVLHPGVHGGPLGGHEPDPGVRLREADPKEPQGDVLAGVSGQAGEATGADMPPVWGDVLAEAHVSGVLRQGMRRRGPFVPDDRPGEPALQGRHQLRQVVPVDASTDFGTGQLAVRRLPGVADDHLRPQQRDRDEVRSGGASHRRGHYEQSGREPDHALLRLPHDPPQVVADTVSVVTRNGCGPVDVYDFQVEGTRNFFANGVLVHNCLIIDDPLKDRAQADSEVYRNRVWEWWTEVGSTRLGPGAPVLQVATRWHQSDLAGQMLAAEDGDVWDVVNIPAQAEAEPDILGRRVGEYMESTRRNRQGRPLTTAQWEAIKTRVGARSWNALYQGRPSPAGGGIIGRDWWQEYSNPLWVDQPDGTKLTTGFDLVIQSWDMAFKATTDSDYVVGQVWARRGADLFLLDQVRGRWDFPETCRQVERLTARWPDAVLKLVEEKANGAAVIATLGHKVPGLVPENPTDSKVGRVNAVAPLVEARNVHLPAPALAAWVGDFVEEWSAFPTGTHDDQVDAATQALKRLSVIPIVTDNVIITDDDLDELRGWTISPV